MIRVLLVEDDLRLAAALVEVLTHRMRFQVEHVTTGAAALAADVAELVLLDLGLPDMRGLEVLRQLRDRFDMAGAGIIILTAKGQTDERVAGLRAGADDYVVKPVSVAELTARMEAVARRSAPVNTSVISAGEIEIDLSSRQATLGGAPVDLTAKEYELLVVLVSQVGRNVSRSSLTTQVWGNTWPGHSRALEVHISGLRAKLGASGRIVTVRGVGYRLAEA